MRILKCDPVNLCGIDAVVIAEETPYPGASCLRIGAYTDPLAHKIRCVQRAASRIVSYCVVLTAAEHRCRDEHIGLSVGLCLQIGDDRQLAHIEFRLANQRFESC